MIVVGLTGGIGMGKSTLARQFAALGAKMNSADTIVHELLGPGGQAVKAAGALFPAALAGTHIDRALLGNIVFADGAALKALESLLHPLVVARERAFVRRQLRLGAKIVVLDIPLLFETGADKRCDVTILASAPFFLQRQRVLARPGMTESKFRRILSQQMPERQKRKRADSVIRTGLGEAASFRDVKRIVARLQGAFVTTQKKGG